MNLRSSRGFTLIEMLLVMSVSTLILGATLMTFMSVVRNSDEDTKRNDTADLARRALDVEARQLRNLAKRLNNSPTIDKVDSYDFIFQTSDPQRTWVRYCLNTALGLGKGRLYEQAQALPISTTTSPVTAAMRGSCPGTGWSVTKVVADSVTNRIGGFNRPIFTYTCVNGSTTCASSPTTYDEILYINAELDVDTTPGYGPPELKVVSGVHLRNQNQAPVAKFSTSPAGVRTLIFNGSQSNDYENRTLSYFWFLGTMPTNIRCDQRDISLNLFNQRTLWGGVLLGQGVTYSHTFPNNGSQQVQLVVCDPGDRYGVDGPRAVNP